jgi:hypothetical protein
VKISDLKKSTWLGGEVIYEVNDLLFTDFRPSRRLLELILNHID